MLIKYQFKLLPDLKSKSNASLIINATLNTHEHEPPDKPVDITVHF